jgi:lysozyme
MIDNKTILELLIKHEGIKCYPYKDTMGFLTIGIGRNLEGRGITKKEAIYLCLNDINEVMLELGKALPWFNTAPDKVQLVLLDMCFNMELDRLLKFEKTLEFLKEGKYTEAAVEMLDSLWADQVPVRAKDDSNIIKSVENVTQ